MPSYDFRCDDCKRKVVLTYKTYGEYFKATPTCPHCKSTHLTRWISRAGLARIKTTPSSINDLAGDESAMGDLANADPVTMARYLRQMGQETGSDLGEEFNDVVDRLESGEDPDSIEASLGESLGAAGDLPDSSGSDVL